jgi:hypothetical protein
VNEKENLLKEFESYCKSVKISQNAPSKSVKGWIKHIETTRNNLKIVEDKVLPEINRITSLYNGDKGDMEGELTDIVRSVFF